MAIAKRGPKAFPSCEPLYRMAVRRANCFLLQKKKKDYGADQGVWQDLVEQLETGLTCTSNSGRRSHRGTTENRNQQLLC